MFYTLLKFWWKDKQKILKARQNQGSFSEAQKLFPAPGTRTKTLRWGSQRSCSPAGAGSGAAVLLPQQAELQPKPGWALHSVNNSIFMGLPLAFLMFIHSWNFWQCVLGARLKICCLQGSSEWKSGGERRGVSQPCLLSAPVLPASFLLSPVVLAWAELLMLFLALLALISSLLIFPGAVFCQDWGSFSSLSHFCLLCLTFRSEIADSRELALSKQLNIEFPERGLGGKSWSIFIQKWEERETVNRKSWMILPQHWLS